MLVYQRVSQLGVRGLVSTSGEWSWCGGMPLHDFYKRSDCVLNIENIFCKIL